MPTRLDQFGAGSSDITGGLEGVANAAKLVTPPEREDISKWEGPSTEYGLETYREYGGHCEAPGKPSTHLVRWVAGGDLGEYVSEHGEDIIQVPETYGGFDNFNTYLAAVDGFVEGGYGYGISAPAAEKALRVLIDNGRYKGSRYQIIPCGDKPWVMVGDEGVVTCPPVPVEKDAGMEIFTHVELPGDETYQLPIEEENTTAITAIKRLAAYLSGNIPSEAQTGKDSADISTPLKFTEHLSHPSNTGYHGGAHSFTAEPTDDSDDGERSVEIEQSDLGVLGTMVLDHRDIPGGDGPETVSTPDGAYATTVDFESPRTIGAEYEEGVAVGYSFDWRDCPCSPGQTAVVSTYHIVQPSERSGGLKGDRVAVNATHTQIGAATPEYLNGDSHQ